MGRGDPRKWHMTGGPILARVGGQYSPVVMRTSFSRYMIITVIMHSKNARPSRKSDFLRSQN